MGLESSLWSSETGAGKLLKIWYLTFAEDLESYFQDDKESGLFKNKTSQSHFCYVFIYVYIFVILYTIWKIDRTPG